MVFPGTGVLDDFGTGPGHVPLQILRWSLAARMTGTRVVFLSIGAGPIVNPMSRRLMRAGVAQADFCSYRDEGSRRYMASIGRRTAEDEVWPDLVFALERRTTKPTSDDPFTVALGIMSYRGWRGVGARGDLAHGRYIDRMVALARRLRASGYDLFLVLGDDSDLSSAVAVARELRDPSVDVIKSADLDDVCEAVTKSGLVISSRYHNLIAALLVGVPAISLSYADKNDQLLEAFGLGEYCQTIEDFDVDLVLAHVEAIRGNHAAIVDELGRRVGATRAEVRALLSRQLAGAAR
jgi:polysaccharide pyruvyl transferase WcaK-like protein